tara:strand:+ start:4998 stop:6026 length:1029 start_codon:yes stop_codon:yes gene_type:complete
MSSNKINIAVLGATGYVGLELVKILSKHPHVNIKNLCARKGIGKSIQFFDKKIKKKLPKISNMIKVDWKKIDVVFTSLPTGEMQKIVKNIFKFKNLKIIDLSADFRISKKKIFEKYYKQKFKSHQFSKHSIYSLSEFNKKKIKSYRIISCPGCYPTSILIPLIPIVKSNLIKTNNIIIDSKSGYSGAGKNLKNKFKHKNLYSSIHAYGVAKHRHLSEIDQELLKVNKNIKYNFTPHLIPTFRGMLSSIYVQTNNNITAKTIYKNIKKYHKNNYFIKILPFNKNMGTENVINTNFCEISILKLRDTNKVLILSAIDNLIKGAAGQAIQNMNLIYSFKENSGLK